MKNGVSKHHKVHNERAEDHLSKSSAAWRDHAQQRREQRRRELLSKYTAETREEGDERDFLDNPLNANFDEEDSDSDATDQDVLDLVNADDIEDADEDEDETDQDNHDNESADQDNHDNESSDEDDDDNQGGNAKGGAHENQDPSDDLDDNFDLNDWNEAAGYKFGDSYPPASPMPRDTDHGGEYLTDLYSANLHSVKPTNEDANLSGGVGNLSLLDDEDQSFFSTATADEYRHLDESTEDVTDVSLLNRNIHGNVYSIQNAPQRFIDLADSHDANHGRYVEGFANTKCAVCIAEMALAKRHARRIRQSIKE